MFMIIHNLPLYFRYADVKMLLKEKTGLTELIVDHLVVEGNAKKVTVALANETDAGILMRNIHGLYVSNSQLYVEDVRQQNNDCPPNMYNQQQRKLQFQPQPPTSMKFQMPSGSTAPNFGVPFYMTSQKQNVHNPEYMVQYPTKHGCMGDEPYEGRVVGFDPHGVGNEVRPVPLDRNAHLGRPPQRTLMWNEQDFDRSGGRKSDWQSYRDDGQSYQDMSRRDFFQTMSNQDYGSKKPISSRFEKPTDRSEPLWEDPDRSTFCKPNEPYRYGGNKNYNTHGRHNQEREAQKFRENSYSQSRGFDHASRSSDFSKKRAYESSDKNIFCPPNKKFGTNQQYQSKKQHVVSGSSASNNNQNKKFSSRAPIQQNRAHVQPKGKHVGKNNKPHRPQDVVPVNQFKKQQTVTQKAPAPPKPEEPQEDLIARHQAWRIQAGAVIATQILVNVARMPNNKRDPLLVALKTRVRARIDAMVGENFSLTLREILFRYRQKFHDDDALCEAVWERVKNLEPVQDEPEPAKKASVEVVVKKKDDGPQEQLVKKDDRPQEQLVEKPRPKAIQLPSAERLPKYPEGDKKVISKLKQTQKEEMLNETLYSLDAEHEKALKEELEKIGELIKQEIDNPESDVEHAMSKFMRDVFIPDLRKILTLHVKKRVLDIRSNLSVRVMCHFKVPNRTLLDAFLKDYGVISLKASDKIKNVLIANCDTYDGYDALCKLETAVIDNLRIAFKPLHLTGPPIRGRNVKKAAAKKPTESNNANDGAINDNKEASDKKLEKNGDVDSKETENKANTDVTKIEVNEDSECEIISPSKTQDDNVTDEGAIKLKEVIILDENDGNTSNDKLTKVDADVRDDVKESVVTVDDSEDDDEGTANDSEHWSQEDDIGDNIDDEDLEDF